MANKLEYIFSLQDKMSAKIGNITVTSDRMLGKFADLQQKNTSLNKTFNETGRTLGSLREKIAVLQAEREWIPADNIEGIRAYNREMKSLNKEITKLESLNGGKFKKWASEAFAAIPGSNLISNPLVAIGAGVGFSTKSAMNFDQEMAKVNITAQLDEKGLSDLKKKLEKVAVDNKTEIAVTPVGFEKINSQLNDVDLSLSILDASLKGSKAGFTDLDTVSGALAQSLSIIGKENASAKEVLDTFFAAKRVGAGEFADFARYMPNLIAGASNMGIAYKEVAGTFAYMTGKGQSAERAAVLMENAFSILGRGEVRDKLSKAGVDVFDKAGKIRGIVDIFKDLQGVMASLSDEQKSSFLEKMGLVDKEAKSAFAILTSDIGKLQNSMTDVQNSAGETDKALMYSGNVMQRLTNVWTTFGNIGKKIGDIILPGVNIALDAVQVVADLLFWGLEKLTSLFSRFFTELQEGNPIIWGCTAALGALSAALLVNSIRANATIMAIRLLYTWDKIAAAGTWLWTGAQTALNSAFVASPLGWIVLAIGAVVTAVTYCWQNFEGFRKVVLGVWSVIKEFGKSLLSSIVEPFSKVLKGIGSVGTAIVQLVKGNFKEAATAAKDGFKDIGPGIVGANPLAIGANTLQKANFKDAWENGRQQGAESWMKSQEKTKTLSPEVVPEVATPDASGTPVNFNSLMSKLGGDKKTDKGKSGKLNLSDASQNLNSTSAYNAITSKLNPKSVSLMPAVRNMAAAMIAPVALSMATPAVASPSSAYDVSGTKTEKPLSGSDYNGTTSEPSRVINVGKVCESVVIHVANIDNKGSETIKKEILNVLNEIAES